MVFFFATERLFSSNPQRVYVLKTYPVRADISDPITMADPKVTAARGLGRSEQMTSFI